MKRTILKTLSLMIALLMLTAFLPAQAADPQNDASLIITISANNKSVLKTPKEGIRLKIYLVATGNYGKWEVLDQYKDIKVFSTDPSETESEWVGDSLTQLHERIETMGIQATKSDFSDASGRVEFNDLPRGIYYVEMTRVPEYLSLNTLLLDVPDSRGSLRASGTTKGEYNPPTPDFDDTDGNNNDDDENDDDDDNDGGGGENNNRGGNNGGGGNGNNGGGNRANRGRAGEGEHYENINDYETALGLGNIQMHVGVCFE